MARRDTYMCEWYVLLPHTAHSETMKMSMKHWNNDDAWSAKESQNTNARFAAASFFERETKDWIQLVKT